MSSMMRTVICLFRNDLRLHDNEALLWAHRKGDRVVPLYCFDPDHFKRSWNFDLPKTGLHRARFMIESVKNLRENIKKANSNLVVEHARPLDGIKKIVDHCSKISCPVVAVVYQKEVTYEELRVEDSIKEFCQSQDIKVVDVWGSSLYHEKDVPFKSLKNVPDTYTQFRKEVEGKAKVRPLLEMPDKLKALPSDLELGDVPTLGALLGDVEEIVGNKVEKSAFPFSGGEAAALSRLNYYLWESHCVAKYKETRNGMIGRDYSTKFSPWLAHGCLSPRKIYWEIKRYEQTEVANQSTYWVIFELIWRDYFKFVCQKYGDRVFYLTGLLNKRMPWSQDREKFDAWAEGRTGVPFVDANMRELKETGWMSNRGRQNVASFLVKDLGIDWRMGAEWFECQE